jgi:hypothetical protein
VREHGECIENEAKVGNWFEICGSGLGAEENSYGVDMLICADLEARNRSVA